MGQIICICDKPGRVQERRMSFLASRYLGYLDVYTANKVPDLRKYDVVYYANWQLAKKIPFNGTKITSVTSYKYSKKALRKFADFSVNNKDLWCMLGGTLTENGVDTDFWTPNSRKENSVPRIGWVGNVDRATKRFDWFKKLTQANGYDWVSVRSSKRESGGSLLSPQDMREFYRSLDFLLVTSETEGTPNPALEAMSCGVPVISTRVGNMPDIASVVHYRTFEEIIPTIKMCMRTLRVRREICRHEMVSYWDWKVKQKSWDCFFRRWL